MKNYIFTLVLFGISIFSLPGESGQKTIKLNERIGEFSGIVYDMCFSDSGRTLIFPESNLISFYDVKTKALIKKLINGHSKPILAVTLSTDEKLIVTGGMDSLVIIRNVQSSKILKKLNYHRGVITSLNMSNNRNLLATGSSDKTVGIYDLSKDEIVFKLDDFKSAITKVKFSPDGKILAVASLDRQIRLYAAETGKLISILEGHKNSVRDLCFNNEGTQLFSCGDDSRLIVWDLKNLNQITKERVNFFVSDWLLSVDVMKNAYAVASLDSKINVITSFSNYSGKIGAPVNKILFIPNNGDLLKFVVATRGKGVYLMDTKGFELKQ